MNDKCSTCVEVKDKPLTYTKCNGCGHWRLMSEEELKKVAKRKR